MPIRTWRGALFYLGVWLPFAASYVFVFHSSGITVWQALLDAFANVFPAAALGLLVLWLAAHMPWPSRRPLVFLTVHVLSALAYALVWSFLDLEMLAIPDAILNRQWHAPHWTLNVTQWQMFTGILVYATLTGISYMLQAQERAAREERMRIEAESLRIRADLNALRSQLNPHFLFNTMNSVIALVSKDPEKAERALLDLSAMLRYALGAHTDALQDAVSLREELEFTNNYLELESLRLGNRLRVIRSISPDSMDLELPSLTLQPLVENAVKHAISPRSAGGTVSISAREVDGSLAIEVCDDGDGVVVSDSPNGSGLGLKTIRRRLELSYQNQAEMKIETAPGQGFAVKLLLPQTLSSMVLS